MPAVSAATFAASFAAIRPGLQPSQLSSGLNLLAGGVDGSPSGLCFARDVESVAGHQVAAEIADNEAERVADRLAELDIAQGADRLPELVTVGREPQDQPGPGVESRHRCEVGWVQRLEHQVGSSLLGAADRVGWGEEEVEEDQEVAPGGYRHRRLCGLALDHGEIDDVETRDRDLLAAIEEFEVRPGEVLDRVAAVGDLNRHLDHGDRGRIAELGPALPVAAALRFGDSGGQQQCGHAQGCGATDDLCGVVKQTIREPAVVHFSWFLMSWGR